MNFNERLKRYREGTATKEEAKLVEKELEKYQSIEEYFSEDLPERFVREEPDPKTPAEKAVPKATPPGEETVSIQKLVNRRLRRVILASVVIVVLLYVTVFYGISDLVDRIYYDPTAVTQAEETEYPRTDFHFDLTAYVSLNMPGYVVSSFTSELSQGFGAYELNYPLRNLFTRDAQRHSVHVTRDALTYADGGIFAWENRSNLWPGFDLIRNPGMFDSEDLSSEESAAYLDEEVSRKNEITLNYLEELNPLSYLSLQVLFEEDLSMLEFHRLSREYPELDFKWVGIRTAAVGTRWSVNQPMHLIGFNPSGDEPSGNSRPDPEKYPLFDLQDGWTQPIRAEEDFGEFFETHFHSRLNYLSKRQEFIEIFDYNPYKADFYQQALDYIETEGIYTYGVVVYGTAEDLSEAAETLPYRSLYIDDVLSASPNIYY